MNEYLTVDPRTALLLAIADDELVTGHRHGHWTGVSPSLEEDLAFSTISQDEINHADVWYSLIASARDPEGTGDARRAVDELGLGRAPEAYRHAVLCERPPRDFAYTLARHWAYDHADVIRLGVLADSSDAEIAAVAVKLLHEERYHIEHADHWFRRLAHGGDKAAGELAEGLRQALPEALWLFEPLPGEDQLVADGILPAYSAAMLMRWLDHVVPALEAADLGETLPAALTPSDGTWVLPDDHFAEPGGRYGNHSEDFTEDVWPEMTFLHRAHPRGDVVSRVDVLPQLAAVRAAVEGVPDPELPPVTLGMLGMVHDVRVEEDGRVAVELLPTFSGCPATEMMERDVVSAVSEVAGVTSVAVRFRFDPPWSATMITLEGHARLREFGIAPPGGAVPSVAPEGRRTLPLALAGASPESGVRHCPYCGSDRTERESAFGPTPCRDIRFCHACRQPFEAFKDL